MIELDNRIIGIRDRKRILFFYFHNSQMNLFKRYLYQNNWIDIEYDSKMTKKGGFLAYPVLYIYKIEVLNKLNHIVYYNKKSINKSSYDFLNSLDNKIILSVSGKAISLSHLETDWRDTLHISAKSSWV